VTVARLSVWKESFVDLQTATEYRDALLPIHPADFPCIFHRYRKL
jgi:hypothetical protein